MPLNRDDHSKHFQYLYDQCKQSLNYHVILTLQDGHRFDGILESVDEDHVVILIGEDVIHEPEEDKPSQNRQYGRPRRYRRFNRQAFPLSTLVGISLLPYPYIVPPYPYYYPNYPYSPY